MTPRLRTLLIVLFAGYAIELVTRNILGLPVAILEWHAFGSGFLFFQPLTRYLVQGPDVISVLLEALALYFLLPAVEQQCSPKHLVEALVTGALGGTAAGLALNALGLAGGVQMGWAPAIMVLVALFGLLNPSGTIYLFFVIPVPAKALTWGSGGVAALLFLATLDLTAADHLGTWAATIAWWYLRGPGARRRHLLRQADHIQRQLDRFQVLNGGRNAPDDEYH